MFPKRKVQQLGGAWPDPLLAGLPIINEIVAVAPNRPVLFSLKNKMPKAMLQLNWDCVGASGAYLGEFFEMQETGIVSDFSAMALFSLAKQKDGLPREAGTYLSMATYIPEKHGYFYETDYKEKGGDIYEITNEDHKKEALKYRIKKSVLVDRGLELEGLKNMLWTLQTPIVIGVDVYDNFQPDKDGVIPLPQSINKVVYGHALTCTGYDDSKRHLEILNSWGYNWGKEGYGYLPYEFPIFATAWTAYDAPNLKVEESSYRYGKERNLASEQRNAEMLKESIYKTFAKTDRARLIAGKLFFIYIDAVTYGNYSLTDITNDLYNFSRHNQHIWNFNEVRK